MLDPELWGYGWWGAECRLGLDCEGPGACEFFLELVRQAVSAEEGELRGRN